MDVEGLAMRQRSAQCVGVLCCGGCAPVAVAAAAAAAPAAAAAAAITQPNVCATPSSFSSFYRPFHSSFFLLYFLPFFILPSASYLPPSFVRYELDAHPSKNFAVWFGPKEALKEKNALMNLPYIIDGDTVVTQTLACMKYV